MRLQPSRSPVGQLLCPLLPLHLARRPILPSSITKESFLIHLTDGTKVRRQ